MRFLFYDRILEMEKGRRVVGLKSFALSEEFLREHYDRTPLVPPVILIEAMAQLLGWSVIQAHDFQLSAILSLVEGVTFHRSRMRPGFQARITGEILSTSERDSLGRAWIDVGEERVATLDRIIYSHLRPVDRDALVRWFHYYCGWTPEGTGGDGGEP